MSIEAMKSALEALELIGMEGWVERKEAARKALHQAIEQAEKQDVPEPLMKIIREKFTSGNSVAVERITLKRSECEAALAKLKERNT